MFMERTSDRKSESVHSHVLNKWNWIAHSFRSPNNHVRSFIIQVEIKHELRLNNYYCYYSCFCWHIYRCLALSYAEMICIARSEQPILIISFISLFLFCFVSIRNDFSHRALNVSIEPAREKKSNLGALRIYTNSATFQRIQFWTAVDTFSGIITCAISSFIDIFSCGMCTYFVTSWQWNIWIDRSFSILDVWRIGKHIKVLIVDLDRCQLHTRFDWNSVSNVEIPSIAYVRWTAHSMPFDSSLLSFTNGLKFL